MHQQLETFQPLILSTQACMHVRTESCFSGLPFFDVLLGALQSACIVLVV